MAHPEYVRAMSAYRAQAENAQRSRRIMLRALRDAADDGHTQEELADALGLTRQRVSALLARARELAD